MRRLLSAFFLLALGNIAYAQDQTAAPTLTGPNEGNPPLPPTTNPVITRTSCRTWLINPTSLPGATSDRATAPIPEITTSCAYVGTRSPRLTVISNGGVYANIKGKLGTCGQQFHLYPDKSDYQEQFSIQYLDDLPMLEALPCGNVPSKTKMCSAGVSGTMSVDETYVLSPTQPMTGPLIPDLKGVGWLRCDEG